MALWVCLDCTAAYAVGLEACPQCQSTEYVEEGSEMPKTRVHGKTRASFEEEGEQPSPGNNSSPSTEKQQQSAKPNEASHQPPVRTTEPPSKKSTGSGTARSTATAGRKTVNVKRRKKH